MGLAPHARVLRFVVNTWDRFSAHGDMLAASIAFFTLLSLAPLVVIAISVASVWVDREYVRSVLVGRLTEVTSADIADFVVKLTDAAAQGSTGVGAAIAIIVLLWAASRLFLQIQDALNLIWGVRSVPIVGARQMVARLVLKRLVSFAMVLGSGVVLISLLLAQALVTRAGALIGRTFGLSTAWINSVADPMLFLAVLFVAFAALFRFLPDVKIRWRDVVVGSAITALLVLAGTLLLGLYLTRIAPAWLQGAAGAIAAFMVWVYYLAQVFLLGAAFTREWSCRQGARLEPEPGAQLTPESAS